MQSESESERKNEVPASPRDEALFHCDEPSRVPRGPANSRSEERRVGKGCRCPGHKTRHDSPVPTLQGPCSRSPKPRGSLTFLPPLEMRPFSIAPNPAESQEALPTTHLVGYSPWGHKELDMTKQLTFSQISSCTVLLLRAVRTLNTFHAVKLSICPCEER